MSSGGKPTALLVVLTLLLAPAAVASTAPAGGGRYEGHDSSNSGTVTVVVTKNRANFASGRFNLTLSGQGGLGSCAGPAHLTLSPTHARQITRQGAFNLHSSFPFHVPSPYGPVSYEGQGIVQGSFSDHGKRVSGTVQESAISHGLTCKSGVVHFTAKLR